MSEPVRPGSRWVRWLVIGLVALVVLAVLFTVVFPWLERTLSNPTIGAVRAHSLEARSATPATIGAVRAHSLEARSATPATIGAVHLPGIMPPGW